VLVENRAGAGGQIAARVLKAGPTDGSLLFLSHDHTISILPQVVKNPGFDPAQDFVPVAGFASFVNALAVSGGTPAKSVNEYVTWVSNVQGVGKGTVGVPAPPQSLNSWSSLRSARSTRSIFNRRLPAAAPR
jgi:tripartite-type tricarboxylate transporter receptor subunit TctC